jgi:uncharacterized protein YukE
VGGKQFGVDPDVLTDLAGRFERESKALTGQVNAFEAAAGGAGQAFGLLGVCDGAAEKYGKLLDSTAKALGRLPQALENDGQGLRVNAANYSASDRTAEAHIHSVGRG